MIHRIYSSLKTFKELRFKSGLNIVLASKTPQATSKQTRNGAGKSSILEIVHFLTAGDCSEESIFRVPELLDIRFGMEFDLGGKKVTVERSGAHASEVIIKAADTTGWPVAPETSARTGDKVLTVKNWDRVLGSLMFDLDSFRGKNRVPYAPSFRSLFPYFVRRLPGGFTEPHLHFVKTKPGIWQVGISYLLGLDWTIPQEWQVVRDAEEDVKKLKSALGEGDLAEIVGKKAHLRSEIATTETAVRRFSERLETFQVLPDFRSYEQRAAQLTQQLSALANENTLDEELLSELTEAVAAEKPPEISDLERAYSEAGISLPGIALKRFDEVRKFHESVLVNRRSYLNAEIIAAKDRITRREHEKREIDTERQRLMLILKSHGALEQFSKLQGEYGIKTAELELLRKRFTAAEKIEEGLAKLKIRRQELLLRLQQDYTEQSEALNKAIVTFEDISSLLYEKAARFTPIETPNGPQFKVEFQGERSPGLSNMQIFCFDMMLTQLASERKMGPGFLIHDSHLFDPVDERQVGTALKVGATIADQHHFQYIVTMNSDKQAELPKEFQITDFQVDVKLTDATETGGLFGFRFG
jgi:uncharacterized protein YydD (DUF2326 family)